MIHRLNVRKAKKLGKNKCLQGKPEDIRQTATATTHPDKKTHAQALARLLVLAETVKEDMSMFKKKRWLLSLWLLSCLALPLAVPAKTIQRCEDASGHLTFTTLGCPHDHASYSQNAYNPPPGSVPVTPTVRPPTSQRATRPLVVAGQDEDGCGDLLDRQQKRQAIISQTVRPGMNRKEVESALGKPDRITTTNALTRYTYKEKKGRSAQVIFDEQGCVKR